MNQDAYDKMCKVSQFTEYAIIEIDEHGDSIDPQHFDSKREAMEAWSPLASDFEANKSNPEAVAAILEVIKGKGSDAEGIIKRDETTIAETGDQDALKLGGWKIRSN